MLKKKGQKRNSTVSDIVRDGDASEQMSVYAIGALTAI